MSKKNVEAQIGSTDCTAFDIWHRNCAAKSGVASNPSRAPYQTSTSATSSGLSCKNIISDNRAQIAKLEFHPPTRKKDKFIIVPPPEALVEGRTHFENCLVGYFLAANASFSSVSGVEEKLWDKENLLDVTATVDGFFFFHFSNVAKMVEVMEVGVWDIAGQPLFLKKWHPLIRFERAKFTSMPVWIQLYNVPHILCTKIGLSYASSVLVLMDIDSKFPERFDIDMRNGQIF